MSGGKTPAVHNVFISSNRIILFLYSFKMTNTGLMSATLKIILLKNKASEAK